MQLFTEQTKQAEHEVVYDLYPAAEGLYLPMAYIVSKDQDGLLAHIRQKALPKTIGSFGLQLDPLRQRLFVIVELLQPKALEERFSPPKKKIQPLGKLMADKEIARAIAVYCHRLLDEMLLLVTRHRLPITWEVDRKVLVKDFLMKHTDEELEPLLHFAREETGVRYRLQLADSSGSWAVRSKEVIPITNNPAWLFVDYQLYKAAHINGNMVKPFREKDEVNIQQSAVKTYFQKFIIKVAAKADIEAEGFEIVQHNALQACRLEPVQDLFRGNWVLSVQMLYPGAGFNWSDKKSKKTALEFDKGDEVRILQAIRNPEQEKLYLDKLADFGLERSEGSYFVPAGATDDPFFLLGWLGTERQALEKAGFTVVEPVLEGQNLYLHQASMDLKAEQHNDWFDLYGQVTVGAFTFPFLALAKNIREGNRLYPLPNGAVFVIPGEWMARYKSLFQFGKKEEGHLRLAKSQYTLLDELGLGAATAEMEEQKAALTSFAPSPRLKAELRPYQLEGVRWLVQLYENQLGACLADDMGLGKTLQTIAVLLHAKERKETGSSPAPLPTSTQLGLFEPAPDTDFLKPLQALIVLPASLVFNWEAEIRRFAPSLQIYRHTGQKRYQDSRLLSRFDVILTTYQTALRDVELLEKMGFEYIVLDESQQIKNKDSKVFRAINRLEANHKISLSGTPIENSLSDLWAQVEFINPGLLGSHTFFQREFITPIEKRQDEEKKARLRKLVQPYLLRRTKQEVARDLPELTIKLFYTEMTAEQKRLYDREKSAARNYLLDNFQADNPKFRFQVLQSLTKLRQLANHPKLAVDNYEKESGKFNDVLEHWDVVRRGGHKALIFSSFVQHLELYRQHFEAQQLPYAWLTGSQNSKQREDAIRAFQNQPNVQPFLISIKSGGTGLNLTAADYVFILDPWWNPTTEQQAIARAHRIGQEKHVIAIKFITKDSIEEKILKLQEKKAQLAEDIIEQAEKASFSKGDIEYLFD
ncbi:MAG: DEAD/DEAH box helicase [Phaeodactylibacter sp.]|nr:DEAD/DEAH box helicase [Phaeodactylibacter sp.]MCB9301608.1 DEAD/DEAH box helicase [Lewinellaceae bacterium]